MLISKSNVKYWHLHNSLKRRVAGGKIFPSPKELSMNGNYPRKMVIFSAILFTKKALLNFCYSIIYYSVAES